MFAVTSGERKRSESIKGRGDYDYDICNSYKEDKDLACLRKIWPICMTCFNSARLVPSSLTHTGSIDIFLSEESSSYCEAASLALATFHF
eukprot:scaffold9352_cov123-Skeletonema_marinoi.AAC.6